LNKKSTKDFVNGKGFYAVLTVCFAVVIISAGVITVNNSRQIKQQKQYQQQAKNETIAIEEAADVLNNPIEPIDLERAQIYDDHASIEQSAAYQVEPEVTQKVVVQETVANNVAVANDKAVTQKAVTPKVVPEAKQVSLSFNANSKLKWPIKGAIVMDYSKAHTIYDKTLEQYRVNESISIASKLGTPVKAAAAGTVVSITNDNKKGCTVVLDHGNGWQTTYSQLQENVIVDQNQVVDAGDVIGGVGSPTKYSILLGEHLDFEVTKDGQSTDPKLLLVD
jgi:murein DD-endopeptidase MepM/ murein hydrolase activator NlpD